MTQSCEIRGRHMFAVGGRLAWADDERAGCYKMPAFIYDLVEQTKTSTFDVSAGIAGRKGKERMLIIVANSSSLHSSV